VDLLRDREAATFAEWLKEHPGTEVICRDRAGAYADGARQGAPDAKQVADRWHLYHNLSEHVEKAVARHRGCLAEPVPEPEPEEAGEQAPVPDLHQAAAEAASRRAGESALAVRTRQRYEQVQALRAQGQGIKPVMRQAGLAKETVRRFYRAATVEELLAKVRDGRPSLLDDYKPYLHQRWNEGCTNVLQLHAELRGRGYRGSYGTVRLYLQPFRGAGAAPPAVPGPPKARDLASWILKHPDNLDDDEKANLARARARARTWTRSPGTSPSSPRSSPACTAAASTTGSPTSRPTTSPTCTPSPTASSATTTPWSTASPCPGAQEWSKATSTGSFCGIYLSGFALGLPWRTAMTGSTLLVPGAASWRGVGPAGVGVSASLVGDTVNSSGVIRLPPVVRPGFGQRAHGR